MALVINSNIMSMNAQRNISSAQSEQNQAMERLTSGKRINSAADDAAGLAISNRMTSQIKGLDQAIRNANDGISLIQTAEGALDESTNILQRMRELSVQSANGTYDEGNRNTLNAEVQQLVKELDRISETTSFNGQNVLDGSLGSINLQVGSESNQTISFAIESMDSSNLGLGSTSSDIAGDAMGDLYNLNGGGAATTIENGDVKINGTSIGAFDASTDSLDDLVKTINSNVSGVTADITNTIEADTVGTGVIAATDTLTMRVYSNDSVSADGTASSYTDFAISNTTSMQNLVDTINAKTSGAVNASLDDNGKLQLSTNNGETIALGISQGGAGTTTLDSALGISDTGRNNQSGFAAGTGPGDFGEVVVGPGVDDNAVFTGSLTLTADDGGEVLVTKGVTGTDADLRALGLQETAEDGVVQGAGNGATLQQGTVDFTAGLATGDLTINGVGVAATDASTKSLQGVIDNINDVTDQTNVVATSSAKTSFTEGTADTMTEIVAKGAATIAAGENITINGVTTGAIGAGADKAAVATAINDIANQTGVTAFVDDDDNLHMVAQGPITLTNGTLNVAELGATVTNSLTTNAVVSGTTEAAATLNNEAGEIRINGQDVALTNLGDINQIVTDLNAAEAQTGVHATLDDNGKLELTSSNNISLELGDHDSAMASAHAMGLTDLISDSDHNGALNSTAVNVNAGIELKAINDASIAVETTAAGQLATGLMDRNAESDGKSGSALSTIDISTAAGAQKAIDSIDNALEKVNEARSELGAVNNRLDFTINNLSNVSENASAARSRIEDADFAKESANLSRAQVLQQAGSAMLAQANAAPQQVLSLLQ